MFGLRFVFAFCLFSNAWAQDPAPASPGAPGIGDSYFPQLGNGGYDALHYDLDLDLDAELLDLVATARIHLRSTQALSSFNLDLYGLEVKSVTIGDRAADFTHEGGELIVKPHDPIAAGAEFVATVEYAGRPQPIRTQSLGGVPVGWLYSKRGVFVVSEPEGASSFYPVNDHPADKATYRIRVTVPAPWIVAANGTPGPEEKVGEKTAFTFTSRDPMASYLVTVSIAEFDVETSMSESGVPLRYWFPKRLANRGRDSLRKSGEMVDFFATKFGPYPFESAGGIVSTIAIPGALETQTAPVYGLYATDELIVAHEIAHQWFGNNVTMREWKDIWLAEGFAEYGAWLWLEHTEGREAFDDRIESEHRAVRGTLVPGSSDPGHRALFGAESYNRGPLVLHALRNTIGDAKFFAILRTWNERFKNATATIDDFIALACEIAGKDVSILLRAWLEDPVAPPLDEF